MILSRAKTLIILDWDDTLFPTTWVTTNEINIKNIIHNKEAMKYFTDVDVALEYLLRTLLTCGHVAIVTNALLNWINTSSTILPRTSRLLQDTDKDILIVSARGNYQSVSSNPMDWKRMAFEEILKNSKYKKVNNIISIGDAEYEYNALVNLYDKSDKKNYKLLKSVKFVKYPTHYVLLDQIKVVQQAAVKISVTRTHLDLKFETMN